MDTDLAHVQPDDLRHDALGAKESPASIKLQVEKEAIKVASTGYIRSNLYVLKGGQDRGAMAGLQATGTDGPTMSVMHVSADTHTHVEMSATWNLIRRNDGKPSKTLKARQLWDRVGYAAWASADPGIQFDTTINDWHTCPADGRINASNPCSEYMFLDDTACNLASMNLMCFRKADGKFDIEGFEHATRLWTLVLEISVLMAQFPSRE